MTLKLTPPCDSSEVVDVFSILPTPGNGGVGGAVRGNGGDKRPETPDTSTHGYKPLKQYKLGDEEPSPQEMAYRSVRRAPIRAASASPKDEGNWEAAKAVMG